MALALLAGCAGSAAAGGRPAQRAADAGSGTVAPRSSATARSLSSAERAVLLLAQERLVSRCMRAKGLTYHAVGPSSAELEAEDAAAHALERAYGSDDVERARREGYGLSRLQKTTAAAGDPVRDHPNTRLVQSMSPAQQQAYTVALFGESGDMAALDLPGGMQLSVSVTGCVAEARKSLYGDVRRYLRLQVLVENIGGDAVRRVLEDPRYVRAVAAWRACMADHGYRYREATDALAAMADRRTAVRDATCNRSARVAATGRRLQAKVTAALAADREGDIQAYRELQATALRRARALHVTG
jgi:hypothetical protein